MLGALLIVPTLLSSGSLHFAEVRSDGAVREVIDALTSQQEVKLEILGDLEEHAWALQRIRVEQTGRKWEDEELELLGDGILSPDTAVAPIVNNSAADSSLQPHFSSFPYTSHLHSPATRLVSLHPLLSLTVSFLRVPEIHDGYERKFFISRMTTVEMLVDSVIEELGLTKTLPTPGGGTLEYVLEEVWLDGNAQKTSRLPPFSVVYNILERRLEPDSFSPSATRSFVFCVPDEWYRRSNAKSLSLNSPTDPSELTLKKLGTMDTTDQDVEEGTAKIPGDPQSRSTDEGSPSDWKGTFSQHRISSLFEGWFAPASPNSANRVGPATSSQRKNVSEPKLAPQRTGNGVLSANMIPEECEEDEEAEVDSVAFEQMLDELNLKGPRRAAMYDLAPQRKRYLLQQNQQFRKAAQKQKQSSPRIAPNTMSIGPAGSPGLIPRLVPHLTGDGLMKRFSIWGSNTVTSPDTFEFSTGSTHEVDEPSNVVTETSVQDKQPIQPQITGGLWSSWWASSGGDKNLNNSSKSAKSYADSIRSVKFTDIKLVKNLISLRVHLSTAKLVWISEFVDEEMGLDALASILSGLVGKGGKKRLLHEVELMVLLEVVKCLRVLLNTEPGFNQVLVSQVIISHIAYSLHSPSLKLRTLTSELLAAICVLSPAEGHKAVLAAMSDFCVVYEEAFRFESLIDFLRLPEDDGDQEGFVGYSTEEEGVWEARTASMVLLNSICNCPEALEERVMLREEFSRRGLNEIVVALRYVKPPDSLLKQLDVYIEEKFEDEEDIRERFRTSLMQQQGHKRAQSDSEIVLEDLIALAKQHGELYPTMVEILNHYGQILSRDIGIQIKADLFTVLDKFVEQAALIDTFDDSWHLFMKRFAASVQHITGQELEVRETRSMTIVEQELEELRLKVEELSDERTELRDKLNQQIAELNTFKSLPLNLSVPNSRTSAKGGENFHGLVQRLVLKEKQVLQLQAELDRFKLQHPSEGRDTDERARRDRDRAKWNHLMEEISKQKTTIGELEATSTTKDKEIIYLKRALESVYTRFLSREELRAEDRAADMDAELIANRTIDTLTQKDAQITALRSEIVDLRNQLAEARNQLAAVPRFISEQDFKAKARPPPPPPVKPKPRQPSPKPSITNSYSEHHSSDTSSSKSPSSPVNPLHQSSIISDTLSGDLSSAHMTSVPQSPALAPLASPASSPSPLVPPPLGVAPNQPCTLAPSMPPPPPSLSPLSAPAGSPLPLPPHPRPPPPLLSPLNTITGSLLPPRSPPPLSPLDTLTRLPPPPPPPPPPPSLSPLSAATGSPLVPPPPPPPPSIFGLGKALVPSPIGAIGRASRPSKRLKPFFWNKLGASAVNSTFWNESSSSVDFKMDDLEAMFSMDNSQPSRSQVRTSQKQTVTTLLEITRANNIAIMLSRIKLGFPEICTALLSLDDQKLSMDDLKSISKQLPTPEEVVRIRSFGDIGKLAKADQYFGYIITIPRLAERLECMLYRRKLEIDIEEIRPELDILRCACRELRLSARFKQVLKAVLTLGNVLNGSSFRGDARGFHLEVLLKMRETKTANGGKDCPTMLHYLARVLLRTDPTLLQFIDEIPHLEAAARVSVQTITQSISSLSSGLSRVVEEIKIIDQSSISPNDRFVDIMQPFVRHNAPSVDALKKMGSSVEEDIKSLLLYYGENPDSPDASKPEDFFSLVLSFSSSLQKCGIEVHDAIQNHPSQIPKIGKPDQKQYLKVNQEASSPLSPTAHTNSQDFATSKRSFGRGDLDQAIRSMRDGKRRPRPSRPLSKIFLDGGRQ